jgi:hypothetical protein
VGPRTGLDDVERRKILVLPGLKLLPLAPPARGQSLYRLCYPDSYFKKRYLMMMMKMMIIMIIICKVKYFVQTSKAGLLKSMNSSMHCIQPESKTAIDLSETC